MIRDIIGTLVSVALICSVQSPMASPFHHPFGELREYHKHWLAVCPDTFNPNSNSEYETTCWASTFQRA